MTQAVNLGVTAVPAGTHVFAINKLPNTHAGFGFVVGTDATWQNVGKLFDLTLDVSQDGVTFHHWASFSVDGPVLDKHGAPLAQWTMQGLWPGAADAHGNRSALKVSDVRITLSAPAAFSIASLSMAGA